MGCNPRLERAGAFYHVINRGNYRRPIFASAGAKHAFLRCLHESGHTRADLATAGKSTNWKLAIGATLKAQTTATNRWLAAGLHLGNLHEVSRKLSAWRRTHGTPTTHLSTPSPKA